MKKKTDKHHRKPSSIGGDSSERNISHILVKKHEAWHMLFSNMAAEEIAREINHFYIDPDYVLLPIFIGNSTTKDDVLKIIRKATKSLDF